MSRILRAKGLNVEADVQAVKIRTQGPAYTIVNKSGPLRNAADRDYCMQYIVPVIFLKENMIDTSDYMDESPLGCDERIDILRAKVDVVESEQLKKDYYSPEKRSCSNGTEFTLKDGSKLEEILVEHPIGHPDRPDTLEQVLAKFKRLARLSLSEDRIDEAVKIVESDDAPVWQLVDVLNKG